MPAEETTPRFQFDHINQRLLEFNEQENCYLFCFDARGMTREQAIDGYYEELASTTQQG
jgi:hypothetical protein